MMSAASNWYVITGAPGSGKTTVINQLAKMGYETFEETGRLLIDEDMSKGLSLKDIHVDSQDFEMRFVKLQKERESMLDRESLIFFDRAIIDTIPFHKYYKWILPDSVKQDCEKAVYNKIVFLLDLLDFGADYGRIETYDTSQGIQKLAGKAYEDQGYTVIRVPVMSIIDRVNVILSSIRKLGGE